MTQASYVPGRVQLQGERQSPLGIGYAQAKPTTTRRDVDYREHSRDALR
jgi:hypothetical protein